MLGLRSTHDPMEKIIRAQNPAEIRVAEDAVKKQQELERLEREATPAFLDMVGELTTLHFRNQRAQMECQYKTGAIILKLLDDQENNGGKIYGSNVVERACKLADIEPGFAYQCMRVAEKMSEQEFGAYLDFKFPRDRAMPWGMFVTLAKVEDPVKRQDLARKACEEDFSIAELERESRALIDDDEGDGKGEETRGRPIKAARTIDGVFAQIQEFFDSIQKKMIRLVFQGDYSLVQQVQSATDESLRPIHGQKLANLLQEIQMLQSRLPKVAERISLLMSRFEAASPLPTLSLDRESGPGAQASSSAKEVTKPASISAPPDQHDAHQGDADLGDADQDDADQDDVDPGDADLGDADRDEEVPAHSEAVGTPKEKSGMDKSLEPEVARDPATGLPLKQWGPKKK